jgi:hypothetical protein
LPFFQKKVFFGAAKNFFHPQTAPTDFRRPGSTNCVFRRLTPRAAAQNPWDFAAFACADRLKARPAETSPSLVCALAPGRTSCTALF